ncbi:MAG: Gfo/Idh/MocA family oxidoreductase [Planctomycetota bacterium]|nr:Gfo/Idh/MocA family oxidoreductase [Planctomycetota bacterium]
MKHNPAQPSPSRRDVLAAGAALSAVGLAATASAQDRPIPKAPDKAAIPEGTPVRIGVIGMGGMGRGHLGSMMAQIRDRKHDFQVVAVCDVNSINLGTAQKTASEGQPDVEVSGYGDYKELLARDDIDGVLIASPEHWHATMSVDAMAAGKDVYCEKPMTLSIDDALWIMNTIDANPQMRMQVGTQYMMLDKYRHAKRLIAEGKIGHPTLSQTSYCRNSLNGEWLYGIDANVKPGETLDWEAWCGPMGVDEFDTEVYHRWRRYRKWSTGIIGDLLVHMMTPMIFALDRGWPTRVCASGGHYIDKAMENHDQVFVTTEFEKDHTMIVAGSTCNENGLDTLIRGHEANLLLGGNNCVLRPERHFAEEIQEQTFQSEGIDAQGALRLNWIECIRTREQNVSPVKLAAQVMVIVDLATRSMWDGGAWTFDPKTLTAKRA